MRARRPSRLDRLGGAALPADGPSEADEDDARLQALLRRLVEDDRRLIECLVREGWDHLEVDPVAISHRALNRRKQRILGDLRARTCRSVEL